ncbi:MAG: molybdopterin-binding protein, partial [Desulfobacterales bacterium]
GLIITTGGVGAEGKDHTVEAVIRLDPDAATPYICKFEKGTGRHVKDGVKIAVGWVAGARIVSLPGPNDEVSLSLDVLMKALNHNLPNNALAEELAKRLREKLRGIRMHIRIC